MTNRSPSSTNRYSDSMKTNLSSPKRSKSPIDARKYTVLSGEQNRTAAGSEAAKGNSRKTHELQTKRVAALLTIVISGAGVILLMWTWELQKRLSDSLGEPLAFLLLLVAWFYVLTIWPLQAILIGFLNKKNKSVKRSNK